MDGPHFENCLNGVQQQLLSGSVIVVDNTFYILQQNETVPTTNPLKGTIKGALDSTALGWTRSNYWG